MLFKLRWGLVGLLVSAFSIFLYISIDDLTLKPSQEESYLASLQSDHFSISAIPSISSSEQDDPIVAIGMRLFLEPKLSSNGEVSCESCHHISSNGAELIAVSEGVNGKGTRNSPTVFNVAFNSRFFWDGRANSLYEQIDGPIHNPLEMNSNWKDIVARLSKIPSYRAAFSLHYDKGITEDTVKHALVTFMRQLNTPGAPFDRYLNGDKDAISMAAINGWGKFRSLGCIYCHQGTNIGGNLFQKFGSVHSVMETNEDLGRFSISNESSDKHVFRVPSLRNVAMTPPYFHDGRAENLEEAIVVMAKAQLGMELDAVTIVELTAFLNSLTAPLPAVVSKLSQ